MGEAGRDDASGLTHACYSVFNLSRDRLIAAHVRAAGTSLQRRRGLLDAERLDEGEGLWITPCEAIHTFGMKMSIDVIFLDRELRVRKVRTELGAARISVCLRAHSVLELAAGVIARSGTKAGDRLLITGTGINGR